MSINVVTNLEAIKQLKRQAKDLKKATGKTHTECLEIVAVSAGWASWHAVSLSCKPYKEALDLWNNGIVVMFEYKDSESVYSEALVQNDLIFDIGFPVLRAFVDESRTLTEHEFWDVFDGEWFVTFALNDQEIPTEQDLEWLHRVLKEAAFFMPLAVFWKGRPVFDASQILCSKENPNPHVYSW